MTKCYSLLVLQEHQTIKGKQLRLFFIEEVFA